MSRQDLRDGPLWPQVVELPLRLREGQALLLGHLSPRLALQLARVCYHACAQARKPAVTLSCLATTYAQPEVTTAVFFSVLHTSSRRHVHLQTSVCRHRQS